MKAAKVIQLCSIGCSAEDCKKYLGKTGMIIAEEIDPGSGENQQLLQFDDKALPPTWFWDAELSIL